MKSSARFYFRFMLLLAVFLPAPVAAERIFFAGYNGGFYIQSEEEGGMALRLGGSFYADYRRYMENERPDNRFDIRQSRLIFRGQLTRWFRFGMEYEFQGNETDNLVDAYAEAVFAPHSLRFGQFKEPFGLEWQTSDKAIYFAERSMGNALRPGRDVGLMLHGGLFQDGVRYAVGVFNGSGDDGSTAVRRQDDPECTARLVFRPFREMKSDWLQGFQLGCAGSFANIDVSQVDVKVKSTGMVGISRNIYVLSANTKFGVLQDAESRDRIAAETAWSHDSFALQGEYMTLSYRDLKPAGNPPRDASFSAWYGSLLWCLTGEQPVFSEGVLQPIYPNTNFNPDEHTYGAFLLAARYDHFSGDKNWITPDTFVSVEDADSVSLAVNWILYPMVKVVGDYTFTNLSDPIRIQVHPDGTIDYVDKENVLTLRFAIDF
ncbi:MAG: OprO/OprP family phosphate-selective porin [Thermodesulfobacteriota bacterium]